MRYREQEDEEKKFYRIIISVLGRITMSDDHQMSAERGFSLNFAIASIKSMAGDGSANTSFSEALALLGKTQLSAASKQIYWSTIRDLMEKA